MAGPTRKSHALRDWLWIGGIGLALLVGCSVWALSTSSPGANGKQGRAQLACKDLETAIEAYIQHPANTKHEFPTTLNDLFEPPFGGRPFLRNGRDDLIDPWGKPYEMERVKRSDGTEYALVKTTAPDGTPISQHGIGENAKPSAK